MNRFGSLVAALTAAVTMSARDAVPAEEPTRSPLKLLLRSSNPDEQYYQGQPIGVEVYLIDERFHLKAPRGQGKEKKEDGQLQRVTVGTREWPWFKAVAIQVRKVEKEPNGRSGTVPVLEKLDWGQRMETPRPGGHVENQPGYHALVYVLCIEPQVSESLEPGRYILKATWDSAKPPARDMAIWHGRLQAAPVQITIVPARTKQDKGKLAYARAAYYMRHKNPDAALKEALKTEQLLPSHRLWQCYTIAARAYEAKGDIRSAIRYYRKFLEAHKGGNVGRWDYLRMVRRRVEELEAKLKKAPAAGKPANP